MNHRKIPVAIFGVCLLLISGNSATQSLGEVARQVRKEREKLGPKAVKVYTNDNIGTLSRPEAVLPPAAEPAPIPPKQSVPEARSAPQPREEAAGKSAKTKEYWQAKFRKARASLARAREEQQLVEDELSLLQIQQIREMDPNLSQKLSAQVSAKKAELGAKRADTAKAQKALDELNKEFEESGAPKNWREANAAP